jgi:hypothetical protein
MYSSDSDSIFLSESNTSYSSASVSTPPILFSISSEIESMKSEALFKSTAEILPLLDTRLTNKS